MHASLHYHHIRPIIYTLVLNSARTETSPYAKNMIT
jgi:hypothetical protein